MKKLIMVVLMGMVLTGCGQLDKAKVALTGQPSKTCVDGVTYLQFTSGATVQLDINGKVVGCR